MVSGNLEDNDPKSDDDGRDARRVVVLVQGSLLAEIVVNGLAARLGPLTVIRERQESKKAVIRRRARLLGWPQALGQSAFGVVQRLLFSGETRIREIICQYRLSPKLDGSITVYDVESVNSEACHRLLRELDPDVVAVYGTRILAASTLQCVDAPFINYHAGINPKYRGQHPGYWAMASGDTENAGITIHLVDTGVDTGAVLYQARVAFTAADSIATYQYLQAAYALSLFAQAVEDGLTGKLNPKQVDLPSKQWFPPTLWTYLFNGAVRGVW